MSDYLAPLEALFAGSSAVHFVFDPATQRALYLNRAFHHLTSLPVELLPRELPRWRRGYTATSGATCANASSKRSLGSPSRAWSCA